MKTTINLSLSLQWICNQRGNLVSRSKWFCMGLFLLLMLVLPLQEAKADYYYEYSNYFTVNRTPGKETAAIDIRLIALDKEGDNDRMLDVTLFYSEDNGVTWFSICKYEVFNENLTGNIFTPYASVTKTIINPDKGFIIDKGVSYGSPSTQAFMGLTWYYPEKLKGKKILIGISGTWHRNYATSSNGTKDYFDVKTTSTVSRTRRDIQLFDYSLEKTPSVSIAPMANGNFNFKWNDSGDYQSKFELYSGNYSTLAGIVDVTNHAASGEGAVKLGLFNVANTYSVKKVYNTPSDVSGFSINYSKNLSASVTHKGYKYPQSVSVSKKYESQIKVILSINEGNISSTLASKYYIKRNGILITPEGFTNKDYVDATVAAWKNYKYVVYSVPNDWADKSVVIPELSYELQVDTKPAALSFNYLKLKGFKGANPYVNIKWNDNGVVEWYPANTVKLYKKNKTTNDWIDLDVLSSAVYHNDLEDIEENKYYVYKLEVDQWGEKFSIIDSAIVLDQVAFTKMSATKNTFGDRINLQWTIDKLNLCDRFEIYRSFAINNENGSETWSVETMVNQFTAQTLVNSWDDRDAAPGTLYKYRIVAIKGTVTLGDLKTDVIDIGFRMPVGVVTGRITYGAGTAVQGTSLYVSSSDDKGDMLYKSLKFSGDASQGGKVNLTKAQHGCIVDNGFTFQAWLQPLNRTAITSTVFEVEGEYSIRMNDDNMLVMMGNPLKQVQSYKLESTIAENSYFHLTVSYNLDHKLKIYINGIAKDSVTLADPFTCSFSTSTTAKCVIANNTVEELANRLPYNGNIDDVRLWNREISAKEVADNFNRYLGGNEAGLIGYWPMDEGISTYAFDCSKSDKVFNENHISEIKKATSESVVPKKEQLSIKGVSDANGNYIIRGIPFTGDGSTYSITPILGTHKFEPKQQLRYVSASSLVHNATDFIDKSSFPVTVNVYYENTAYPVEGVSFYIDDNPVSKENKLVVTDEEGKAVIDVPIGEHYINASLVGHVFKNNGRWPSIGKVIVDENIEPITFVDSTLVSITGRVAGGLVEDSKPVGFKKGNANIGSATVKLVPALNAKSSLNNVGEKGSKRSLNADPKGNIKSVSTIPNDDETFVEITTDSVTGEYFVMVPPIKEWKVTSVSIKPNGQVQQLSDYNKSIRVSPLVTAYDTCTVENKLDTLHYNVKQNFIYRVPPTITVKDVMAKHGAFGDSTYVINNVDPTKNDTISLYKLVNGVPVYLLGKSAVGNVQFPNGKPVFTMGDIYTFEIKAYEEYINHKKDTTKVPLAGAAVTVDNEMGKLFRPQASGVAQVEIPKHEMLLNDKGLVYYRFLAGFPNIAGAENGMSLNVSINYNNIQTKWENYDKFRGIVLGYEPVAGANFKTRGPGPLVPLVVLRDPPGSNSYAYMEKGTELKYSMSHKHTLAGSFAVENKLKFGTVLETSIGLGFTVTAKIEVEEDLTIGLEGEYSSFTGTVNENKLLLKERIQTSASPDFVGSMADVYIGTSTNVFTTDCNFVEIGKDNNGVAKLINPVRETSDLQTDTEFRLSQYEIVTAQIPAWKKTIRSLFLNTNPALNTYKTLKGLSVEQMIDSMGKDHSGKLLYEIEYGANGLGDQVDSAFNQIKNWQDLIKRNEMAKFNAKTSKVFEKTNISFDAGTYIERSYSFSTKSGTTSGNSSKTQESISNEIGLDVNGFGMEITLEQKFGGGRENESSSTTENSTSFGYVLSDPDTDNRFSVNVYKNKFLSSELKDLESDDLDAEEADATVGSYIFELAAGQTSCPYEKADNTLYYKGHTTKKYFSKDVFKSYTDGANLPLKQLSTGSQALDVPKMDVLPGKEKLNVPNGKAASFTLLLQSASTGYSPRPYILSVDESSNTDGAIISVDGTPLTEPRTFYITKEKPLEKTLTVRQSKYDVLDYDSLKLKFSSACNDVTDAKFITVKFVPSCSDLDLVIDSLTMNTKTGNSVLLKLRNFDQDYTNFKGIKIQYKLEGEKDWDEKLIAKDTEYFQEKQLVIDSVIPDGATAMNFRLSFKGKDDGRYQVRAMTICSDPTSTTPINNITPEYIVVKDMSRPSTLGTPSPSNGILTPEDEIAVTFNESLQTNKMVNADFVIEGVLNGAKLQHSEGLSLDNAETSKAYTEMPISLQKSSFAIEAWVNMKESGALGTIFAIGEGENKLSLKMNRTSVALFVNDVQLDSVETIAEKNDWQYVSLNYDAYNQKTAVYVINSSAEGAEQTKLVRHLAKPINPDSRLTVGSGFKGKMHQLVVWNVNRSISDLNDMNYAKTGIENNIVGYWPMDEASGKTAVDKVRGRNLIVGSSWFIDPSGKSAVFDGNRSVVINTELIPITSVDNFSLEFWFSGSAQKNATLFSCGKGIGDVDIDDKLSIGFNDKGALSLSTKGVSYVIADSAVLDANWHHFAMSVSRNANASVYIDGKQQVQIPATKISGLANAKMTIGSRSYLTNSILQQDQYFKGKIDEFRIWNSALSSENIRLDMRSAVEGTSGGLIAYYTFDELINANSFKDGSSTKAADAQATNMMLSDLNPGIKMVRQKQKLSFNYTASDNKIIFTINEPLKKIENCILEFSILKVIDMNGNTLISPVKWTAFVNNNRLNWETDQMSITKEVLASANFKTTIVNKSGKYENFVIDGLPGWLSVNKTSGRLNPLEKTELTFTVDNSVNIGSYESSVTLTGNNGIQEMFPVSLKVTGPRPDWFVNPHDFESTMNITGKISIEDVSQEDTEDILAAFIGDKCVGLAQPRFNKVNDAFLLYMDVYGNTEDTARSLTFSLWDAGTGRIYPDVDVLGGAISFSSGSILGSVNAAKGFNATDKVEQQISIQTGWNWISTNVVNTSPALLDQLQNSLEAEGNLLKSQSGYNQYADGGWDGTLSSINQTTMYLLRTAESKTIKMIGAMAKAENETIVVSGKMEPDLYGWSWIGYIPQFVTPLQDALNGLVANEGDLIKGQMGFATYSGDVWTGSLQYLIPGNGYMFGSTVSNERKFVYPSQYISRSNVKQNSAANEELHWTFNQKKYPQSMTATSIVQLDGLEIATTNMQVGVFIDNECRGVVKLLYSTSKHRYFAYVSIWGGNADMNKKITFKCFNPITNIEYIAEENTLLYVPDKIVGSTLSPYVIGLNSNATDISQIELVNPVIYPNPVVDVLNFSYNPQEIERLEIVDCTGRTQVLSTAVVTNSINVNDLIPGIYTLRVNYRGDIHLHRFVKK